MTLCIGFRDFQFCDLGPHSSFRLAAEKSAIPAELPTTAKNNSSAKPISAPPPEEAPKKFSMGSALLGTGLVIGVHLGLRKLFPALPSEPQFFLNLASIYGLNSVMSLTGVYPNYSWKTFTGQVPGMFSLGFLGSILVDGVARLTKNKNLQSGSFGHEMATWGLTFGAFYTIAGSEALSPLLTGGIRTIPNLSWASPAGGAGALGAVGQVLKIAGLFGIANMALGAGKWVYFHASGNAKNSEGRLDRYVDELRRMENSTGAYGKYAGALYEGFLGHLSDSAVWVAGKVVKDVGRGGEIHRQRIKDQLINGSKEFGKGMRKAVAQLVTRSLMRGEGQIDWQDMERDIQKMYATNPKGIQHVYKLLKYTGFAAPHALGIKDAIGEKGLILNRPVLERIAKEEITRLHEEREKKLPSLLQSIGLVRTVGNQRFLLRSEDFSEEQKTRVEKELKPLAGEIRLYAEVLKRLH